MSNQRKRPKMKRYLLVGPLLFILGAFLVIVSKNSSINADTTVSALEAAGTLGVLGYVLAGIGIAILLALLAALF